MCVFPLRHWHRPKPYTFRIIIEKYHFDGRGQSAARESARPGVPGQEIRGGGASPRLGRKLEPEESEPAWVKPPRMYRFLQRATGGFTVVGDLQGVAGWTESREAEMAGTRASKGIHNDHPIYIYIYIYIYLFIVIFIFIFICIYLFIIYIYIYIWTSPLRKRARRIPRNPRSWWRALFLAGHCYRHYYR